MTLINLAPRLANVESSPKCPKNVTLDLTPVLILTGEFAGESGICLGISELGRGWAISVDGTDRIITDVGLGTDFELLIDLSSDPDKN